MLNIDYFISRLEELMDNHQLSAAAFAEKIGVQRSSVSHILSKRNKPSLEFILKINAAFDSIGLDWLLLEAPKTSNAPLPAQSELQKTSDPSGTEIKNLPSSESLPISTADEVVQIIQLYQDGSFRTFSPKS